MQGVARIDLDGLRILALTDGGLTFADTVFPGVDAATRDHLLNNAGLDGISTEFTAYALCYPGGAVTLVDTGCGTAFGDAGGALPDLLAACKIAPADVTRIIFTHLHGDHCGGTLLDGTPVYPNAEVHLHKDEATFWAGKDTHGGRVIDAYAGQMRLLDDDTQIDDLLTVWALPGHTPGHIGLRIGAKLVLVGDVIHSEALQLPDPQTGSIYDTDAKVALESRLAALSEVADNGLIWCGSHMLGPDRFARLQRKETGFQRVDL